VVTATAAIASKFVLRWCRKHVFNSTNFGLVVTMLVTGQAWVSPGRWGSAATFGFLLASAGCLVVTRAGQADVTLVFLGTWAALLLDRSMWLCEPVAIPIHRLESGALIAFAFSTRPIPRFMESSHTESFLAAAETSTLFGRSL
jgi:Na+-transporting NADH:ubiquinone oxidoreductase subunit NqrB